MSNDKKERTLEEATSWVRAWDERADKLVRDFFEANHSIGKYKGMVKPTPEAPGYTLTIEVKPYRPPKATTRKRRSRSAVNVVVVPEDEIGENGRGEDAE